MEYSLNVGTEIRHETHYGRVMRCFVHRPSNVGAMFDEAFARQPNAAALVIEGRRLSYAEVEDTVERISANLAQRGFGKGDRIGMLIDNRPEFLFMLLAAARLGAIAVPMNVRQRRPEIQFMLSQSGARMLVFEAALAEELPDRAETPGLEQHFHVGGTCKQGLPFETLLDDAPELPPITVDEEDPLCILYTSGTTGQPKGAVLTHFGLVHTALHYEQALGLRAGDVSCLAVPALHVTGLAAILLATLRVAGTTVIMPQFKAQNFLEIVERERVNYTLMVPAMYNLCLLSPDMTTRDLSSWRVGGFGGAPMPVISVEKLAKAVPGLRLSNIYGATETSSPVTILPADDIASHGDSVGLVLPCADIIIVDDQDREVTSGQVGELLIAGPMVTPGYWDNEAANATSFVGGYWRSGDLGSKDADGYVRIHDRLKDVVNRGGYKIYCIEVENVILRYPGIEECAVVGYPDSVLGERVAVFVRGHGADQADGIRAYCAKHLSDYKVPERVIALDEPLPRNANGKIVKKTLRERIAPGR
jgi:long-chain acyl-CoA synthetase